MDTGGQRGSRRRAEAAERRGRPGLGAAGGVTGLLLTVLVFAVLALVIVPRATPDVYRFNELHSAELSGGNVSGGEQRTESGDIVTIQPNQNGGRWKHSGSSDSALQSGEKALITKGDNNGVTSPTPIHAPQIKGKLFYARLLPATSLRH